MNRLCRVAGVALVGCLTAPPLQAQVPDSACAEIRQTDTFVVRVVEGDPIDPSQVLAVQLQDSLVVEARSFGPPGRWPNRWRGTLPRPLSVDAIRFRGIEGLSYRQGRPPRMALVDGSCVVEVVALYDVSVRVSVSVRGGDPEPVPVDAAARFAGLTAVAVSLANAGQADEARAAALQAHDFLLNPDSVRDPRAPELSDPTYELAGAFLLLDDPVRAEALHLHALAGRQDPGYETWMRERYGIPEGEPNDLRTLLGTSMLLSYLGMAESLEKQGRTAAAAPWRTRADSLQQATGLTMGGLPGQATVDEQDPWGRKLLELNGSVGILNDEPEYTIEGIDIIRRDAIGTVRVGYITDFRLFAEAHVANSLIRLRVTADEPGLQRNMNAWFFGGNLGFNVIDNDEPERKFQVFAVLGAEAVRFLPDGLPDETDLSWIYGIGGRYALTANVAIRLDLRMHHVRNALEQTLEGLAGLEATDMRLLELGVGVSWLTWPGYPHRRRDARRREAGLPPAGSR